MSLLLSVHWNIINSVYNLVQPGWGAHVKRLRCSGVHCSTVGVCFFKWMCWQSVCTPGHHDNCSLANGSSCANSPKIQNFSRFMSWILLQKCWNFIKFISTAVFQILEVWTSELNFSISVYSKPHQSLIFHWTGFKCPEHPRHSKDTWQHSFSNKY